MARLFWTAESRQKLLDMVQAQIPWDYIHEQFPERTRIALQIFASEELRKMGVTRKAAPRPQQKIKPPPSERAKRNCLSCREEFNRTWVGNFVCPDCARKNRDVSPMAV